MKTVLFILLAMLLGGCVNSTLVVRGNFPGTAQIATLAVNAHKCEDSSRFEKRVAKVSSQNRDVYTYVRHECTN